jgi:hypothetical protein
MFTLATLPICKRAAIQWPGISFLFCALILQILRMKKPK